MGVPVSERAHALCLSAPYRPLQTAELFTVSERSALSSAGSSWTQRAPATDAATERPEEHEPARDAAIHAGGAAGAAQAAKPVTAKGRASTVSGTRVVISLAEKVKIHSLKVGLVHVLHGVLEVQK